ncbi:MAG: hypothetical protein U0230_00765 [Polyangiales bacterium]
MSAESRCRFEAFRDAVVRDDVAVSRLLRTRGQDELFASALDIAAEKGLRLEPTDLIEAANAARRAHLERWLP